MPSYGIESDSSETLVLQNAYLRATLCSVTGRLVSIANRTQPNENMIAGMQLHYRSDASHGQITLANAQHISHLEEHHITAVFGNEQIRLTLDYTLAKDSPFLKIRNSVESLVTSPGVSISHCVLPGLSLAADFNDLFEDPRDLYFDGAELNDGYHLPAWRVFFRAGYDKGLLLATRNRPAMGRFNFLARAIECRLVIENNYATNLDCVHEHWPLTPAAAATTEFEIGPWNAADHHAMLKHAKLHEPVRYTQATPLLRTSHSAAASLSPVVPNADLLCLSIAQADNIDTCSATQFHTDRWLRVTLPDDPTQPAIASRQILFANTGVSTGPVIFTPPLRGPHHVFVGIAHGSGITLQQSNSPCSSQTLYREGAANPAPFKIALRSDLPAAEVAFGVVDLQGQSLHLNRFPNKNAMAMIQYIRFEPAGSDSPVPTTASQSLQLAGFADTPDLWRLLDADDPDPGIVDDVIQAHAQANVRQCFWRIDGQCADFPSRHNTMRYISAKVHGVFSPQVKSYGRLLRKTDLLERAVQAGKANDVSMWGWMRFNNYSGNVASDFFKENPQFREETEYGAKANQLCLAFEEVRAHKRKILVEAAAYGLDGLCLGFLRHPPVLSYAKVFCDAYEQAFGCSPPRDKSNDDYKRIATFPPYHDAAYRQWWQFRADYLTLFGRELKAELAQAGLGHVKIAIWVRANHCLYDGIDLDAWLAEGLCDQVVSSPYRYASDKARPWWYWEPDAWIDKVRARVPLYRDIGMDVRYAKEDIAHALTWPRKYDGLCLYESNMAVMDSAYLDLLRQIKQRP